MNPDNPIVLYLGELASGPEGAQLGLACRFYGFDLTVAAPAGVDDRAFAAAAPTGRRPILVVVPAATLRGRSAEQLLALRTAAESHRVPIAVVGVTSDCSQEMLVPFTRGAAIRPTRSGPGSGLWVSAADPANTGFELRGLRLPLGPEAVSGFECPADSRTQVLATVGPDHAGSQPALLRLSQDGIVGYLLARVTDPKAPWPAPRSGFGEIAPLLLLLRDVGGARCWHPAAVLANLTIDDPWLTEPYGCLSFPGLLEQMQRERFHATIGFVPWNYDRSFPNVVELFRANPKNLSLSVHGNNHDRYEFFHYAARSGARQRAKPLEEQAYNIRQALVRMAQFHRLTGLHWDRVMVFPHGVCPGPTLGVLKQQGFWLTSNYSNVPLGEPPPADPVVALRSANAEWAGFPALRRAYPQKYPEEAMAIDLFLGNPVMFMAHQDLFFDGIDAFTPYARQVNLRQPAVQWASLGEISRRLHLLRWPDDNRCEVRLVSRHALLENPRTLPVEFRLSKREPDAKEVAQVTVNGRQVPWTFVDGEVRIALTLGPGTTGLVEVHYREPVSSDPVGLRRSGVRNRILRLIADFRDLTLSRSWVGRFLTRKYYGQGKRKPARSTRVP